MSPADPLPSRSRVARFGDFTFDLHRGELCRDGDPVDLRPKAVPVLAELIEDAGSLVAREQIVEAAWGDVRADVGSSLHNVIRHLREALGDDASRPRYIETVYGRGYRFVAEVDIESEESPRDEVGRAATTWSTRRWLLVPALAALLVVAAAVIVTGLRDRSQEAPTASTVLRGRYLVTHGNSEQLRDGLALLRLVAEEDAAGSALAWSGIATAEARLRNLDEAAAAARRALELDPESAEAIRVLAEIAMYRHRDWDTAERRLLRSLSIDPKDAGTHIAYATLLLILDRREEALYEARLARGLAPLSPADHAETGRLLGLLGEHEVAVEQARRALELDPSRAAAHGVLHASLRALGEVAAARDALAEQLATCRASPDLVAAMRRAGPDDGLRMGYEWLATAGPGAEPDGCHDPLDRAAARLSLGDRQGAWEALAAAERGSVPLLPLVARDPRFEPLYGDARFEGLVSRLGIPRPVPSTASS